MGWLDFTRSVQVARRAVPGLVAAGVLAPSAISVGGRAALPPAEACGSRAVCGRPEDHADLARELDMVLASVDNFSPGNAADGSLPSPALHIRCPFCARLLANARADAS